MSRCKQCNVEILDETERCPLCHSVLEKTVEVENMYPNVRTMTRRLALLSRIYLFVAILVEALLIYLNVLSDSEMFWSAIPGLAMLYGYLVLRYAILGKSGYKGKIITGLDGAPGFNTTYGGDCSNIYYINNINTEDETIAAKIAEIQNDVSAPNKYFLGYDIVMAAAACIAKVGTDYTALHDALENLSYEGVTGKITIDPTTHMPTGMSMYMYTYDNQTPVMLEQFAG